MSSNLDLIGYHLTFDAEMTSAADMAKFSYSYEDGGRSLWSNHEAQYYTDYDPARPGLPFAFENGALSITASPTPTHGLPYTSGLIQTANTFTQTEGYFEIRAQTPSTQGFWSAFWMLPKSAYYPEVDILEQPNNSGSNTKYWFHIATPSDNSGYYTDTGVNVYEGYHAYGFKWTNSTIEYFFDGKSIGYLHQTPPELADLKMYLIANLAVGGAGSWPGEPAAGASATYKIDYIRAYSKDPSVPAVALGALSSPDGVNTTPILTVAPSPSGSVPTSIFGQGPDTLVLRVSEDAYQGDAQFTLSVDGVQQGGVLTTTASHATGQSQAFTVLGSYGSGAHTVTVNFLNDVYGGSADKDRNLYVSGATINGTAIAGSAINAEANGPHSFSFTGTQTTTMVPSPITPMNTLVLKVSGDSYLGSPHFIVTVDGKPAGGTLTTTASHAAGQTQDVTLTGSFGAGPHEVAIKFIDDAYGGSPTADRNLYVHQISLDGQVYAGSTSTNTAGPNSNGVANLWNSGSATFHTAGAPPVVPTAPTPDPGATDTLIFKVSGDSFQGAPHFIVTVDGQQVGGTLTTSASHAVGQTQDIALTGSFGAGPHEVAVKFIDDVYGGSPTADRNLYVHQMNFDGQAYAGSTSTNTAGPNSNGVANLWNSGSATFQTAETKPIAPTPVPTAADTLVFKVSGDSYQGTPHFVVTVDGQQVGGTLTTSAAHASGQTQDITLTGHFGAGPHDVAVKFLDDAWGGSAATDRNLYVHQVSLNGQVYAGDLADNHAGTNISGVAYLLSNGTADWHL